MPKLIIDDREIEVPEGTRVIEAAEHLGIMIPRFCYHPALGAAGACRVCAVKVIEGPVKGIQMSCMLEARDGMVVSTTDEEAMEFRRFVIELLMLNHPHDCPVCDEGGHCLLQDETVSGGHAHRRTSMKKRTYRDQDLGPFIRHEMNRCIHCYRCSRFYQDFAGGLDYGPLRLGDRTYFGRFTEGRLESPFAGNLIDVCPTGTLTDKPSRYSIRRWHGERGPSLCISCSLGCSTVANAYLRDLVRIEANYNESVNGFFICDRGRFGFYYAKHPERPRRARVDASDAPTPEALREAAKRLARIAATHGPGAVACIGSTRSSLETMGALVRLCATSGWRNPVFFSDPAMQRKARTAVSRIDKRLHVSLREIEKADFILSVGADPLNEAPMLALAMRQASRNEAAVAVIDSRPVVLPFDFERLAVARHDVETCLNVIMREAVSDEDLEIAIEKLPGGSDGAASRAADFYTGIRNAGEGLPPEVRVRALKIAAQLKAAHRPVIVCGVDAVCETTPALAADHASILSGLKERAGIFYILPGANAFGAALLSSPIGEGASSVFEEIEKSEVKALVVVECDPLGQFPDRRRIEKALGNLEFLVVLDYLPSETVKQAHIFVPTTTHYESGGCFVNQEGRAQFAPPVYAGGEPNRQETGGAHPPRVFRNHIPGGGPEPAWKLLALLGAAPRGEAPELRGNLRSILDGLHPAFEQLADSPIPPTGERPSTYYARFLAEEALHVGSLAPQDCGAPAFAPGDAGENAPGVGKDDEGLEIILTEWTFGSEELSSYSPYILQAEAEKEPCACMQTEDASRLGISDGDLVALRSAGGGSLTVRIRVVENMARGCIILPRHGRLAWQDLEPSPVQASVERVKK
jgi:NADH-quinone oxidoreductase subunit G